MGGIEALILEPRTPDTSKIGSSTHPSLSTSLFINHLTHKEVAHSMLNHARNRTWRLVPKPAELHLDHQSWANVRRLLLRPISYRFESVMRIAQRRSNEVLSYRSKRTSV
jgi:hypothetical protein